MRISSLYMHSDTIFMHLLEFGPILSIIHGFSSKNVNVHFIALHVYRHYLQAFARVWFTSGDFSRIFDKNTCMCIFSLYMYSDDICSRLIHFRSFFTDFRQKHVYVHFFALHVFFSYLLAGGTSG